MKGSRCTEARAGCLRVDPTTVTSNDWVVF